MSAAYAHCAALLRAQDRDAWLESLFSPPEARPHLHALRAFGHEIGHVRQRITAPLAGEIRLQWWRDAIAGGARGDVAGHPVAAALLATIEACKLPRLAFDDMIEARIADLYDDPPPDAAALEQYCGATDGALVRLSCLALAGGDEPGGASACGHAGMALGIARLLRAGRGLAEKWPELARMHLRLAEAGMAGVRPRARPAFLGLAQVEPDLRRPDRAAWRRQWALWRYIRRL